MNRSSALLYPTAIFCLLISGAAGLVYQVVWMRYLSLFLGHTSYAVVAVLVAFMGGLALGNAWLGARADRVRRPLALYAWLEIGIALYAVFFTHYYEWCDAAYVGLVRSWQPGGAGLLGLKFGFSLLTILLPTVLMGGTLPVMTRLVTHSLGELRERVSTLYFINSLGAVVGCFLADFWWVPSLGLQATVLAGAALNFVVGAGALFVSGWIKEEKIGASGSEDRPKDSSEEEIFTPREITLAVVGIGISGFVAMLYEVVWTRMLALALGSSTHAFSLMLITFITGIAGGAWMVGRWKRGWRTLDAFGWTELALAITLLVSMFFYERVPYWFTKLANVLVRKPEVYPLYELVQSLICFAVMFVPTVCLGLTLPLVSRIATVELPRTGRSVGRVFSVNTLGTVLGAAVTGLWLLPWLGLARTLALGIALNAGIAAFVLSRNKPKLARVFSVFVPIASVTFVIGAGVLFGDTWRRAFTMGLWRGAVPVTSLQKYRLDIGAVKHAYYRDGAVSTVSVDRYVEGGKEQLALRVNGKPEASTTSDVVTQLLLGHIPMFLRLDAKRALVIGLGSGMTGGAVMQHPGVEQLDVVEISPEIVRAARLFTPSNGGILNNPRVRVVVEDAKSFLRATDRKYDVIISEPSNPWMAGVAAVFSLEYYENCRAHLTPGGIMAQWVQRYESNDGAFQIVLKTFGLAFPFFSVWEISSGDLMLLGSSEPLSVDFRAQEQRMNQPAVKADLARIDLFRLPVLLARETISPENARFIAGPSVAAHSDFYPVLEYAAQRAFFVRNNTTIPLVFTENGSPRPGTLLGRYLQEHPLTEADFKALALFQTTHRVFDPALFHSLLKGWQNTYPQSPLPMELAAKAPERGTAGELEAAQLAAKRDVIFQEAAKDPELLRLYARFLAQTYLAQRSAFYLPPAKELESALQRLIETDSTHQRIYKLRLAGLAWDRKDDEACLRLAQSGFDPDVRSGGPFNFDLDPLAPTRTLARVIDIFLRRGKSGDAWKLCQQARTWGYIGTGGPSNDPLLDMTYRKVEALIQQTDGQANTGSAAQ